MGIADLLASATPEQRLAFHLEEIFMPEARRRREEFLAGPDPRFVHYTSAEAAISILEKKRLWLRNTTAMTDSREILHGFEMVRDFANDSDLVTRFRAALDKTHPGIAEAAIKLFFDHWKNTNSSPFLQTYIGSISEHDPQEDKYGRLTMWRAFGSSSVARVALVFRVPPLSGAVEFLRCVFSPVSYLNRDEVKAIFEKIITNIETNEDFLRQVAPPQISNLVFYMFVLATVCIKHGGFREEREWRIVYSREFLAGRRVKIKNQLSGERETIGGIPQLVYK